MRYEPDHHSDGVDGDVDDDYQYDAYDDEQPFWRVEAEDADRMMRFETQAEETFRH